MLNYKSAVLIIFLANWIDSRCIEQQMLLDDLIEGNKFSGQKVKYVMLQIDRRYYVPKDKRNLTYKNMPLQIGFGATISSPETHAVQLMVVDKNLKEGKRVLDVGCGSGLLTACLALMVGQTGYAVGIDHIPELVERAKYNVKKDIAILMEENRTRFVVGDGRLGCKEHGPYDVIHVGALLKGEEVPSELLNQLKKEGRLVAPVERGGMGYELLVADKDYNGNVTTKIKKGVIFYDKCEMLTDKAEQLRT